MSVDISYPGRKKEQTEAGSKEIRVTSVAKSVQKTDLEGLFSKVNPRRIGAEFDQGECCSVVK